MDLLKQELERKRKALKQDFGERKFFKRSEIEKREIERIKEEEKKENELKAAKLKNSSEAQKDGKYGSKSVVSENAWKSKSRTSLNSETEDAIDSLILPKQEVIRRLRMLKQPITLFGEDDETRLLRLKLIMKSGEVEMEGELMEGQRNDFLRDMVDLVKGEKEGRLGMHKDKLKDHSAISDLEARDGGSGSLNDADGNDNGGGSGGEGRSSTTDNDIDAKRMKTSFEELCDEDRILVFFKKLLREWEIEMDERSDIEKRTAKGKANYATVKQCGRYIDSLFRMCRKKQLYDDIKEALVYIVKMCREKDYLAAMDKYIRLAIGNAPWPIGVTMVGIHERSAREKIHTNTVAHIMNDETTRKYLQSVKRLMTFCQRKYPAMPSKSVEFDRNLISEEKLALLDGKEKKSLNGKGEKGEERLLLTHGNEAKDSV